MFQEWKNECMLFAMGMAMSGTNASDQQEVSKSFPLVEV